VTPRASTFTSFFVRYGVVWFDLVEGRANCATRVNYTQKRPPNDSSAPDRPGL